MSGLENLNRHRNHPRMLSSDMFHETAQVQLQTDAFDTYAQVARFGHTIPIIV